MPDWMPYLFLFSVMLAVVGVILYNIEAGRESAAHEGDTQRLCDEAALAAHARLQQHPPAADSDFEEWLLAQEDRDTLQPAEAWLRYRWTLLRDNDESHMELLTRALACGEEGRFDVVDGQAGE